MQMNTRIDGDVKRAGDAVFAEAGYSPSQVVREVWGFAGRNRDDAGKVAAMLEGLREDAAADDERKRRRAAICKSGSLVTDLMAKHGFAAPAAYEPVAREDLRDMALEARFEEKGLL